MLVSILLAAYAALVVLLIIGLSLHRGAPLEGQGALPGISVIIPFRNEARRLERLLSSLAAQRYDGAWEVLLVNDGSDDGFQNVLGRAAFPGALEIVDSAYDPCIRLTSKQQALDTGAARARHEWLLFTDADMLFERDWLASLARNAVRGSGLIFGHTKITAEAHGIFAALQRFQLEFLFAAAYAFHVSGIDGSCMGNNLLVRKQAYAGVGGQAGIGYSITEDRRLYAAFKRKRLPIAPANPFAAKAATYPCDTAGDFYHQMLRWARGGFSMGPALLAAGLLFAVQGLSIIAAASGLLSPVNTALSVADFVATMLFTHIAFKKMGSGETALFYPVHQVFAALEAIIFCLSFLFTPAVVWKKRPV